MFMACTIIFSFFIVFIAFVGNSYGQPTTPYITQVFAGKCLQRYSDNTGNSTCDLLWNTFSLGAMMDMSRVTDKEFQPFFDAADFTTKPDNALFWSGSKDFANRLASDGTYYTTLEETQTGYILNGLSWCGSPYVDNVAPSFDYADSCNFLQNDTYYGAQGVWRKCSQYFASKVSGNITVLLEPQPYAQGGPYLAYRNTSIFYQIELPNINPKGVTAVKLLVITDTTNAPHEKCGSGSLVQLNSDIEKYLNIKPECYDDPADVLAVLCLQQDDNSPECVVAAGCKNFDGSSNGNNSVNEGLLLWAVVGSGSSVVLIMIIVVLALKIMRLKSGYEVIYGGY